MQEDCRTAMLNFSLLHGGLRLFLEFVWYSDFSLNFDDAQSCFFFELEQQRGDLWWNCIRQG